LVKPVGLGAVKVMAVSPVVAAAKSLADVNTVSALAETVPRRQSMAAKAKHRATFMFFIQ